MAKKILPLLFFLLIFSFISFPERKIFSQEVCEQIVPVGQIGKRVLEIRDELLFYYTLIEQKGSQLIALANEVQVLLKQCPPTECIPGECSNQPCEAEWSPLKLKWEIKCPLGGNCQASPGLGPVCPPELQDQIKEKVKKMDDIQKELKELFMKSGSLIVELSILKNTLNQSEARLKAAENRPDEEIFSCFEANSLGLKEDLAIFGIGLGIRRIQCKDILDPVLGILPLLRRDGLDYYICPK